MRILLFLFLLFFLNSNASSQENRSATELAKENISEYLQNKLFIGKSYSPVSFDKLISFSSERKTDVAWTITHDFLLGENKKDNIEVPAQKHEFIFYLDRKMTVLRADSYQLQR